MQILRRGLLLLCCVWAALAQNQDKEDAADAGRNKKALIEPIQFVTKAKDQCSMTVSEQEEETRLRVQCQGQDAAYGCEFVGKPAVCRNYVSNPRHFFTQIMWELRKQQNACNGLKTLKPSMCKKASAEAQLELAPGSSSVSEQVKPTKQKPAKQRPPKPQPTKSQPARPPKAKTDQPKPEQGKPVVKSTAAKKVAPPKTTTQTPTTTEPVNKAKDMAQKHCWEALQDVCTHVIGWFTK